jgi:dienelactone hydrolase
VDVRLYRSPDATGNPPPDRSGVPGACRRLREHPVMTRRLLAVLLGLALLATSCADGSEGSGPADDATTTTLDPMEAARAYVEPGPHPVGVTTLALESGPEVEVWYPAVDGTSGTVAYDTRDFVPPAIRDILTADIPAGASFEGARDAEVADGEFPIVLHSHGFAGFRLYASHLTSHLASYGMIVLAPDHPSRDLFHVLSGEIDRDPQASVDELLASLDLIVAEGDTPGSPFEGHVDPEHVAALGHSAGGGTILGAAQDERVDGYVSMASGGPDDPADYPDRPSFFLAGSLDEIVPAAERTRPAFDAAPSPSLYWELDGVGHNGFDDLCTFGGGTGIIGVAEASGLGPFLDSQPQLRALGEDGCVEPAAPIEDAVPAVDHGVTAWLRWLFEEDPEPVGLDPTVPGAFAVEVTAESKEAVRTLSP